MTQAEKFCFEKVGIEAPELSAWTQWLEEYAELKISQFRESESKKEAVEFAVWLSLNYYLVHGTVDGESYYQNYKDEVDNVPFKERVEYSSDQLYDLWKSKRSPETI